MPDPASAASHALGARGTAQPDANTHVATHPARPRHAASLLLWRMGPGGAEVLMGRRHSSHRFMPERLVFPGGRVDPEDARAPAASELAAETAGFLGRSAAPALARALAIAAARELHEETGLTLGSGVPTVSSQPVPPQQPAPLPELASLRYLCRAITPTGSPIRFNARFLIAPAEVASGTLGGSGELLDLDWYPVEQAPVATATITQRILEEFRLWLAQPEPERALRRPVLYQGHNNRGLERR